MRLRTLRPGPVAAWLGLRPRCGLARPYRMHSTDVGPRQFGPLDTNYYAIDLESNELGRGQVERSRLEARIRYLADRLFMTEQTNRAILEADMDGAAAYPHELLNKRELAQRPARADQSTVGAGVRALVARVTELSERAKSSGARPAAAKASSGSIGPQAAREPAEAEETVASCLAGFYRRNVISRLSTHMYITRRLVVLGHLQEACTVMNFVLMSYDRLPLSAYTLCLELASRSGDKAWFYNLVQAISPGPRSPRAEKLAAKFRDADCTPANPRIQVFLARGFVHFKNHKALEELVQTGHAGPAALAVYVRALWSRGSRERVDAVVKTALERLDPDDEGNVPLMRALKSTRAYEREVAAMLAKLSPKLQAKFLSK